MLKTLLIAILIVALAVVLLGVKVLFVKGGRFPSGHAGAIPELRRRGIGCATDSELRSHSSQSKR